MLSAYHAVSVADYYSKLPPVPDREQSQWRSTDPPTSNDTDEVAVDSDGASAPRVPIADDGPPSIPRLVIAVDDADNVMMRHAAFLPQLIDLADRSRHLGIHLIVAAEQLSRSIEHALKSFANIRIGLRMNDPAEAVALMGNREAVQISMHTPGRGAIRIGDGAAQAVQFASAASATGDLMEITPFILARDLNSVERKISARPTTATIEAPREGGLPHLVAVVGQASRRVDGGRHQILCPDLPGRLPYEQISSPRASSSDADGAAFALSDLPDDHTQNPRRWNPAHDGNLLIIGGSPSERSSALATLCVAGTDRMAPDRLQCYVIDCAPGLSIDALGPLESLAACGAVASTDDPDRILRVLVRVVDELEDRATRDHTSSKSHIVLVVNDIGSLLRTLELGGEFEQGRELLERIVSNGPLHSITTLMSSASENAAPARMVGQFQQRIILHLDDRSAYRAFGIDPGRIPVQAPGRAITLPDLVEIQIGSIADLSAAVEQRLDRPVSGEGPADVPRTPDSVSLAQIAAATEHHDGRWLLPVGLDARSLQPALLHLQGPGAALVLGDAGTGKSTVLTNLARCALDIGAGVDIHAIASTWSPLLLLPGLTSASTLGGIDKWAAEFFATTERDRLVLVDDADRLEGKVFERLAAVNDPRLVVIVAGRTRGLEIPTHWTAPLRRSRTAVILRPLPGDGAMFGLHLRVTSSHPGMGRGVLIDDDRTKPVLLAGPVDDSDTASGATT